MFRRLAFMLTLGSSAIFNTASADIDTRLKPGQYYQPTILDHVIRPSRSAISIGPLNETKVIVKLVKSIDGRNEEQLLETPELEINCKNKFASTRLTNDYFKISYRSTYEIQGELECGRTNTWFFDVDSTEGQVMAIHDIAMKAVRKFNDSDLLSFWKKRVNLRWPSDGDYYSWNTVNITRGHFWDVVGHELGHAIYDQANIGVSAGGRHRIDECYNGALALSEGWASFFSAWLSIDLKDSNASFEYMVKRRAPLNIESVPTDVCHGPTNEWRVTAFLWDIIDLSYDGESAQESFAKIWKMTLNENYRSINQLAKDLTQKMDPILVKMLWEKNFLTQFDE